MKASEFDYERPDTLEAALALLADDTRDATPLAGGQSLMPMMNFRLAAPGTLVDLNRISGLRFVRDEGEHLVIGAMTRYRDLDTPAVARSTPLIALALPHVAHPAIRNRGTIGGSVALADPAAEMPAVLLAMGATVVVASAEGRRDIPAENFFLGLYETALDAGELVVELRVPKGLDKVGFYELARRHGDYATAGVAIAVRDGAHRVAFFGISDRAIRAKAVEISLVRGEDTDAAIDALPIEGDVHNTADTKRHLAKVVLKRALAGMTT